jgi:hypothetical protein
MNTSMKWLMAIIVVVAFIGLARLLAERTSIAPQSGLSTSSTISTTSTVSSTSELDVAVPPGNWYSHRIGATEIIFTRHMLLPTVPATSSLSSVLGSTERIEVYETSLEGHSPQSWAALNVGTPTGAIGVPPANAWGTLSGYTTVHAVIANQYTLDVIFANGNAYEFTLYPYPNSADEPILQNMMSQFATQL